MTRRGGERSGSGQGRRSTGGPIPEWAPFRPDAGELGRLERETSEIAEIQAGLLSRHPEVKLPDRVAHQYQIAGGRASLLVANDLPAHLEGVGLFEPGSQHVGIYRLSTGLGFPHIETDPDFLGLMVAFRTESGRRVDLLAINDPAAPSDDHLAFITLLHATLASSGVESPFASGLGGRNLTDLAVSQTRFAKELIRRSGMIDGLRGIRHILKQSSRTLKSSTAYQSYWTGVVETGGHPGKFVLVPISDENGLPGLRPGERYLSEEWRERQRQGAIDFDLHWLPFLGQDETPLGPMTREWTERRQRVGRISLPQADPEDEDARLWASLAAEMGANPGNWVRDRDDTIRVPGTEFTAARMLAYRLSQKGRNALPEEAYEDVFVSGKIPGELEAELRRRREEKERAGHRDTAGGA